MIYSGTVKQYRLLPVRLGYAAVGIAGDDDATGIAEVGNAAALQVIMLDRIRSIGLNVVQRVGNGSQRSVIDVLNIQITRLVDADTKALLGLLKMPVAGS